MLHPEKRQAWPRRPHFVITLCAALALLIAGCATGNNTTSVGGSGGGGGAGGGGEGGAPPAQIPCSAGDPCDPGAACYNGACAAGCNSDADCGADQFCALDNGQICAPTTLLACPDTSCAPTQVCVQGLCGTVPSGTPCGPSPFNPDSDGCPADSLCLKNVIVDGTLETEPTCYSVPACDEAHPCSPGGAGAVCSIGLVPKKDGGLCIPGGCVSDANCPSGWKCVQGSATLVYGQCTDGAAGHPCAQQEDCDAGLVCDIPVLNEPGTCQ